MERPTETQTWFVVFDRSHGRNAWWKPFTHKKFQHVYLFREFREFRELTMQFNPLSHLTAIMVHDVGVMDVINGEIERGVTAILSYTVYSGAVYKTAHLEPHTCVSAVKRVLGLRSRLITPKALYHELIKAGAHVVKPYCVT